MNNCKKTLLGGTAHEYQPEMDWWLCADFEDFMPEAEPMRHEWHNSILGLFEREAGVKLSDLKTEDGDPDYGEVARRLNANGFDTYESDNYFEVYNGAVPCAECATL